MACLVISPAIDAARLTAVREVVQDRLEIVNAATPEQALAAMPRATAFFGKITPPLLQQAGQLQWVQSATASLEHYVFPELVEHSDTSSSAVGSPSIFTVLLPFVRSEACAMLT